jgi:tryptophanyl-tRNA synthetase
MSESKKRRLTGLKPTGKLHIGNYFGALQPFLNSYDSYDSFLMVADYHALTTQRDAVQLHQDSIDIVKDYLAAGLDPTKATLFRQSDNQDHMELAWVCNCMVTVPFLQQAHAYKDKVAKGQEANVGLFTYPMLMAADILLYETELVPVGEDQRQHVEYAREVAGKFNRTFGETLIEPQEQIIADVGVVPGTDGQKMSKSYNNTIPLFGTAAEIEKAVMGIVTDSGGDRPEHVYAIHRLLKSAEELNPIYEANKGRYGDLKKLLASDLEAFIAPMRAKRESITDEQVRAVLSDGVAKAKKVSNQTIAKVRTAIGINL